MQKQQIVKSEQEVKIALKKSFKRAFKRPVTIIANICITLAMMVDFIDSKFFTEDDGWEVRVTYVLALSSMLLLGTSPFWLGAILY